MKDHQFDSLIRQLATDHSRRRALKTLVGAMVASFVGPLIGRSPWKEFTLLPAAVAAKRGSCPPHNPANNVTLSHCKLDSQGVICPDGKPFPGKGGCTVIVNPLALTRLTSPLQASLTRKGDGCA